MAICHPGYSMAKLRVVNCIQLDQVLPVCHTTHTINNEADVLLPVLPHVWMISHHTDLLWYLCENEVRLGHTLQDPSHVIWVASWSITPNLIVTGQQVNKKQSKSQNIWTYSVFQSSVCNGLPHSRSLACTTESGPWLSAVYLGQPLFHSGLGLHSPPDQPQWVLFGMTGCEGDKLFMVT